MHKTILIALLTPLPTLADNTIGMDFLLGNYSDTYYEMHPTAARLTVGVSADNSLSALISVGMGLNEDSETTEGVKSSIAIGPFTGAYLQYRHPFNSQTAALATGGFTNGSATITYADTFVTEKTTSLSWGIGLSYQPNPSWGLQLQYFSMIDKPAYQITTTALGIFFPL